jgi:hypothetical protein
MRDRLPGSPRITRVTVPSICSDCRSDISNVPETPAARLLHVGRVGLRVRVLGGSACVCKPGAELALVGIEVDQQRVELLEGARQLRHVYAESMRLSSRWADEFRRFWDLPTDFDFPVATPTVEISKALLAQQATNGTGADVVRTPEESR